MTVPGHFTDPEPTTSESSADVSDTQIERDIVDLFKKGLSTQQIAERFNHYGVRFPAPPSRWTPRGLITRLRAAANRPA